jgi:oxygen-independent coproporphyrinogen-3 oxidase
MTRAITAAAGMPAYEVSNHARPGQESRHNLTYWRYRDYAGIGPGAHGRRGGHDGHQFATTRHKSPKTGFPPLSGAAMVFRKNAC